MAPSSTNSSASGPTATASEPTQTLASRVKSLWCELEVLNVVRASVCVDQKPPPKSSAAKLTPHRKVQSRSFRFNKRCIVVTAVQVEKEAMKNIATKCVSSVLASIFVVEFIC